MFAVILIICYSSEEQELALQSSGKARRTLVLYTHMNEGLEASFSPKLVKTYPNGRAAYHLTQIVDSAGFY